jgi:hypothetical protein
VDTSRTPRRLAAYYTVSTNAPDVDVDIVHTESLTSPTWSMDAVESVSPSASPSNGVVPVAAETLVTGGSSFIRLRVRHDE